jgi:putative hydrolase of HD superfamily
MGGVLPSYYNQGGCWNEAIMTVERTKSRNSVIAYGSPSLWQYAEELIDDAVEKGFVGGGSDKSG